MQRCLASLSCVVCFALSAPRSLPASLPARQCARQPDRQLASLLASSPRPRLFMSLSSSPWWLAPTSGRCGTSWFLETGRLVRPRCCQPARGVRPRTQALLLSKGRRRYGMDARPADGLDSRGALSGARRGASLVNGLLLRGRSGIRVKMRRGIVPKSVCRSRAPACTNCCWPIPLRPRGCSRLDSRSGSLPGLGAGTVLTRGRCAPHALRGLGADRLFGSWGVCWGILV